MISHKMWLDSKNGYHKEDEMTMMRWTFGGKETIEALEEENWRKLAEKEFYMRHNELWTKTSKHSSIKESVAQDIFLCEHQASRK